VISNAVSRGAQSEENWERSLDLERIGGSLPFLWRSSKNGMSKGKN